MSEVKQLYQCVVCGKAWPSKQSLRAHLKAHKKEGYKRTSILVKADNWAKFEEMAKKHKTTTCHLNNALIEAAVKGEEQGLVTVGSPNPVLIQVNHVFLSGPRSRFKVDVSQAMLERIQDPRSKLWPPNCDKADTFFRSSKEVGCLRSRDVVSLRACWECYYSRVLRI